MIQTSTKYHIIIIVIGQNVSDIRKFLQPIIKREEEFNGKQEWRVTVSLILSLVLCSSK